MTKRLLFILLLAYSCICMAARPLPANDVFRFHASVTDPNTVTLSWEITPGHFLYKDRIRVQLASQDDSVQLGNVRYPRPSLKHAKNKSPYPVYRQQLNIALPILAEAAGNAIVKIFYQGCADSGYCYPPQAQALTIAFNQDLAAKTITVAPIQAAPAVDTKPQASLTTSDLSTVENILSENIFFMALSFLVMGLFLAFTPCVLPMIPIISSVIVQDGDNITATRAFKLSLVYVLSMAITYSFAGVAITLVGSNIQTVLQTPAVLITSGVIFILLALAMFGYYDLNLPSSVLGRLATISRHQQGKGYLGVAVMGCLATLIVSPCVTPPLVGVLTYLAHRGDVLIGALALFMLGIGMGLPLIAIAVSGGKLLPKAGQWMNHVKTFFGLLLLLVAVSLFSRVIGENLTMVLVAIWLVITANYLGAWPLQGRTGFIPRLGQGLGFLALIYAIILVVGSATGHGTLSQPLRGLVSKASLSSEVRFKSVTQLAELEHVLSEAKREHKPVLVKYYADWCLSCKVMEETLFNQPTVKEALDTFVRIKVDVTANNKASQQLLKAYGVIAPPTFIFIDSKGEEHKSLTLVGEIDKARMLKQLEKVF